MNKKAFEIQFNWIFVLVAGAAILLFFTAVVVKQKSVSEASTKATVLKSIEAIITGASVSIDTINIIDIPDSNIEVDCDTISLGGISKQYQNLILFAPSSIKGNKLITQTLPFSIPYRATNLLYMTSPKIRYIIIGNSVIAKEINKSLPSDLNKEFYETVPTIANKNDHKVKLAIFDFDVNSVDFKNLEKMPDNDVTAIKVNGDIEKGSIDFYQKRGSSWESKGTSYYLTKSSLIGAIYSDTKEIYECNIRNVFNRLKLVTDIYVYRTNELNQQQSCIGASYASALNYLGTISAMSLSLTSSITEPSINTLASAAKSLAGENKNAQVYSCTLIY